MFMALRPQRGGGSHVPNRDQRPHLAAPRHQGQAGPATGRYKSASRVSEIDAWDNMQNHELQNDSSSSDEDLHPRRHQAPSRPRHTRSVSHPFPSFFSSIKRKRSGTMAAGPDESGSDSMGEGPRGGLGGRPLPLQPPQQQQPSGRGHRTGSSVGSRDVATGNCMTCGSPVEWPRELLVYRCYTCHTINDLQPLDRDARREDSRDEAVIFEEQSSGSKDKTISLGYTKSLVKQCLRSFLASALRDRAGGAATDKELPVVLPTSHLSPDHLRVPPPPPAVPLALRPKASLDFEPRPVPGRPKELGLHRRAPSWAGTMSGTFSTSFPEKEVTLQRDPRSHGTGSRPRRPSPSPGEDVKSIFRPLEDYVVQCFTSFQCLNSSFLTPRSQPAGYSGPEARHRRPSEHTGVRSRETRTTSYPVPEIDPKLLLLGDFAENGTWWTGHEEVRPGRTPSGRNQHSPSIVSSRSPHIDWTELEEWYTTVIDAARFWPGVYESLVAEDPSLAAAPPVLQDLERRIVAGQEHVQEVLLKASERVLVRPGRRLTEPRDLRFLLIITANPLLHSSYKPYVGRTAPPTQSSPSPRGTGPVSGRHSGIIKRIIGLMSNASEECRNRLVAWFARYPEHAFVQTKDLVAGFLAYRLIREKEKKYQGQIDYTGGLIPDIGPSHSPAALHAALGSRQTQRSKKQQDKKKKKVVYRVDWRIKAAAQVLGLLFAANNMGHVRRGSSGRSGSPGGSHRGLVRSPGQILATSDFYVTLLDDSDLVGDFEAWERKLERFSFCQHPFLLSIGAKIQILEYEAKRQMENKARDAFFDSILTNRVVQQFLVLNIRRECLVDDSLKAVSEVIGSGGEDIKKGLRINFKGEEGVDAGGLRKEWFLLLVREVFNPDHGMFLYDEDSNYCYFNPNSLESSEQFFLVGVVFGLAIYNSTILDVALPPFAFRKLLAAAPPPSVPTAQPRQPMTYTLDDLAEYRPRLAHGLRQLLEFEGDVESTFGLDFTIDTTRYGAVERVLLCPGGDRRPVTNANRREYVDAYVRHVLDTSVARQFEPFKRGFYTVCSSSGGGSASVSALSLFRPEEIELLVRGSAGASDQTPLDVPSLRAVAQYDGWKTATPDSYGDGDGDGDGDNDDTKEPTVRWFWEAFESAAPRDQRRLLAFITGSDRIPALGAASLGIRISCLGDECGRFPTARTCFNSVGLWRSTDRERFVSTLWRAVWESEGFGLK
ncbi:hypothetical protein MYCTH_2311917 [Thermothelomyces thermophilus ATCC 42464]|uniref:HECT-type E3 ubiquitin transferase n=1 Tax=Thermothelomyces thermophilus (strain ATCC 42464 / BCRC 31852 / DSM 1799) TaxID=573729 RepID=G2QPT7_THET4|nr:uncharacterized protein MYCTH_2311917 [Thermothelomyces thermophilus ATCC 42464]AEO61600.1 hypothetical protein MYCTH_2311917 [Thermothelomyces thermophilus ATCC 42464]